MTPTIAHAIAVLAPHAPTCRALVAAIRAGDLNVTARRRAHERIEALDAPVMTPTARRERFATVGLLLADEVARSGSEGARQCLDHCLAIVAEPIPATAA